jgi:hypothetical protein
MEGRNQVRVYQNGGAVPEGFLPVEPNLEDAYFVLMAGAALHETAV